LYFISPKVTLVEGFMKDTILRFYTVEHISLMLIAAIFITIGHSKSKKAEDSAAKFKKIAVFYTVTLLLVLVSIPWPFRIPGAGWF